MKDNFYKRKKEKEVVGLMIDIYAKGHKGLKEECRELKEYAFKRVDLCPFMETKTFCSNCKVHCYEKDKRIMIKEVMRYSGPRMLLHHPLLAIRHLIESKKEKRNGN